jgi:hypothetical protein
MKPDHSIKLTTGLLLSCSLLILSCGEGKRDLHDKAMDRTGESMVLGELDGVTFENDNLDKIWLGYDRLRSAFVASDAQEIQERAKSMLEEVDNQYSEIREQLEDIAETDAINTQRSAFARLSENIESILSPAVKEGQFYKQYCPMAFNNRGGYWLSSKKTIENPYFGDKMLTCGSVEQTFTPAVGS